jgi:hypothetical protein
MGQRIFLENGSRQAKSKDIPQYFVEHVHNSPALVFTQSQINQLHIFTPYFFMTHFCSIPPSMPVASFLQVFHLKF